MLVRASYGTGFRAPTLADLYTPVRLGQTNGVYNDLLGCIKTATVDNTNNPDYCGIQPDKLRGGSPDLKPETSTQFTIGLVLEPVRSTSVSIDYFNIKKRDVHGFIALLMDLPSIAALKEIVHDFIRGIEKQTSGHAG